MAERQKSKAELLTVVPEQAEKLRTIFVIPEDSRPLVPLYQGEEPPRSDGNNNKSKR